MRSAFFLAGFLGAVFGTVVTFAILKSLEIHPVPPVTAIGSSVASNAGSPSTVRPNMNPSTSPTTPSMPQPPGTHDLVLGDLGFISVAEGSAVIGSPLDEPSRHSDERQRLVVVPDSFYLLTTEVTQSQYERRMQQNPSKQVGPTLPVTGVAWDDTLRFCDQLTSEFPDYVFRLPTEEEWEYACRAGTSEPFSVPQDVRHELSSALQKDTVGDHDFLERFFKQFACFNEGSPQPVASRLPNAWKLHDLQGNVWEWCANISATDPEMRIIRGGAFTSTDVWGVRSAARGEEYRDACKESIGFRIVAQRRE